MRADAPVLFNDPFVRALLEGDKRSFRRPIDPQPELCHGCQTCQFSCDHFLGRVREIAEVGQKLWVKESWMPPKQDPEWYFGKEPNGSRALYRADFSRAEIESGVLRDWKWRATLWASARTMARSSSRLELEVTDYWVERLQALSQDEARGEGIPLEPVVAVRRGFVDDPHAWADDARTNFAAIWDRSMAPAGFGWDANPYVHVVEFRVIKGLTGLPAAD